MKIIKLLILLLVACSLSAKAGVVKISGSLKQFGLDRVSMNSDGIAAEVYHDRTIEIILDSNGRFDLKLKLKQPHHCFLDFIIAVGEWQGILSFSFLLHLFFFYFKCYTSYTAKNK